MSIGKLRLVEFFIGGFMWQYKVTAAREIVMGWDSILVQLLAGLVVGFLLIFVLMNILVGCESWTQDRCITPYELIEVML
jgi:hypothetical protein